MYYGKQNTTRVERDEMGRPIYNAAGKPTWSGSQYLQRNREQRLEQMRLRNKNAQMLSGQKASRYKNQMVKPSPMSPERKRHLDNIRASKFAKKQKNLNFDDYFNSEEYWQNQGVSPRELRADRVRQEIARRQEQEAPRLRMGEIPGMLDENGNKVYFSEPADRPSKFLFQ